MRLSADKEKQLQFVVTPLNGRNAETKVIPLTDGGTDGAPFTRYHMEMKLAAPDKVLVKVTDLGFGEFFTPGGQGLGGVFSDRINGGPGAGSEKTTDKTGWEQ